ncbi:BtpA/SgcQ family protein [Candidatus Woesearchaeota archaeon]|nr:BtpA/SgcQ family protein [Candidatus Woesearchaeota archaeon]
MEINEKNARNKYQRKIKAKSKKNILIKIFKTERPIIGVIHLSPLLGYKGFECKEKVLQRALADAEAFEKCGISGIIVENNYDLPHKIMVGPETVAMMSYLICEILKKTHLPLGVSVLWNDYKSALAIATVTGCKFIRIPVFVDKMRTSFGDITGNPKEVLAYRKKICAEKVALFADIQVKHAQLLEKKTLALSAQQAIAAGADTIIVTGKWTGDAPTKNALNKVRKAAGNFPLLIGSGAAKENIQKLLKFANGAIVSTSLKTGINKHSSDERNLKSFQERIDTEKVKEMMRRVKNYINLQSNRR